MRLRGRFTLWFSIAALAPIAVAAVVTREMVSRSERAKFEREYAAVEEQVDREIARLEASVAQPVNAMADRGHHLVGGLLLDLGKGGGTVSPSMERLLEERSAPVMRGFGLDLLLVVGPDDIVLVAPHQRAAIYEPDPSVMERARATEGRPYYTREVVARGGSLTEIWVVESARVARDGPYRVAVAGGRELTEELVAAVRRPGLVAARIVTPDGRALVDTLEDGGERWRSFSSAPTIERVLAGPNGEPVARVEVAISDAALQALLREITFLALGLAGAALVAIILIGWIVARGVTRDLDKLVEGAQAAARGDLEHRVDIGATHEIGEVARAFNTMMDDLETAQDRLVIAERIAAWQEIARRLAHEIKNPLTPIQMSVETMRKTWAKKHPKFEEIFEESTGTILEETGRLKRVVAEFSEFARMPQPSASPCDVNEIVSHQLALYEGVLSIVRDLDRDLPDIEADKDQLSQVVLNLLENARDAVAERDVGGGAFVTVSTRLGESGDRIRLIVDDNGPGIAPEARAKLFTPYYTTKHSAGGTGLGLAIVHRIVSDHGGRIYAGDAPTGGARFVVELPLVRGEALSASRAG